MDFDNPTAFAPFYDETAVFSGTRLETGESDARALSLSVPCCVLGGTLEDAASDAIVPGNDCGFSVWVRKSDWVDHLTPQRGDALKIEGYPAMRVVAVQGEQAKWVLSCRGKVEG